MNFRTRFNVEEFERSDALVCASPSLTQQHFKDECDINTIISKYKVTGILGDPNDVRAPLYADVSDIPDLMTAQNIVSDAYERFDSLPSDIRKRFDNSPLSMLEFLQDSNNREEAEKLGLINPRPIDSRYSTGPSLDVAKPVVVEKAVETVEKLEK